MSMPFVNNKNNLNRKKISYDEIKFGFKNPEIRAEDFVDDLLYASLDSFYRHQLKFDAEKEGRIDIKILLYIVEMNINRDYIINTVKMYRGNKKSLDCLYQIAYSEEEMMRLTLLCCWDKNHKFANKFLHYFKVTPSILESRMNFVAHIIDVCLERNTINVVENTLSILSVPPSEKLIYFMEKAYKKNNIEVKKFLLKIFGVEKIINILMNEYSHSLNSSLVCDWLLEDFDNDLWEKFILKYPEISEHCYSTRRKITYFLKDEIIKKEKNEDESETDDGKSKGKKKRKL